MCLCPLNLSARAVDSIFLSPSTWRVGCPRGRKSLNYGCWNTLLIVHSNPGHVKRKIVITEYYSCIFDRNSAFIIRDLVDVPAIYRLDPICTSIVIRLNQIFKLTIVKYTMRMESKYPFVKLYILYALKNIGIHDII